MDNLSGQKEETFWDDLGWALDNVADGWGVMMNNITEISVKVSLVFVYLVIVFTSPVWVGPYLLWRKHRSIDGQYKA